MPPLSAGEILGLWEAAAYQAPLDRALTILAAASPGTPREELARLPIGERDARLLDVRERTFGPAARGVAACEGCAERVEFALDLPALRIRQTGAGAGAVATDGWTLRFRVPNSEDLAAATGSADPRGVLVRRCLTEALRDGRAAGDPDLPGETVAQLAAAMAEQDPQAEVLLDYRCPACGRQGRILFDIVEFLWDEVRAQARRLLVEVSALARAYGWREADILAMSAMRRRAYLELAP
jgi:hypothetical protein